MAHGNPFCKKPKTLGPDKIGTATVRAASLVGKVSRLCQLLGIRINPPGVDGQVKNYLPFLWQIRSALFFGLAKFLSFCILKA